MEKDIDIDDLTDTCIRNVFRYLTIADRLIAGKGKCQNQIDEFSGFIHLR